MNEPLLVVEPRGHANRDLARLDADRLRTESEIRNALERSGRRAVWVAPSAAAVQLLLAALAGRSKGDQRLLSLEPANGERHSLLHAIFRFVVSADEGIRPLRVDELADVLGAANREDLFVGVAAADAATLPIDGAPRNAKSSATTRSGARSVAYAYRRDFAEMTSATSPQRRSPVSSAVK